MLFDKSSTTSRLQIEQLASKLDSKSRNARKFRAIKCEFEVKFPNRKAIRFNPEAPIVFIHRIIWFSARFRRSSLPSFMFWRHQTRRRSIVTILLRKWRMSVFEDARKHLLKKIDLWKSLPRDIITRKFAFYCIRTKNRFYVLSNFLEQSGSWCRL